ncbi:SKP1-like protein 4 [Linum grandiflorum]
MGTDGAIPLDNVTDSILRRVIKYCRMHTSAADEADKVRKWDQEFVKVNLAKTTEEMRKIFNIKNDSPLRRNQTLGLRIVGLTNETPAASLYAIVGSQ